MWREFSAAGFEDHPADCAHCWELANPALDDFLHRDAMHALLPPKTREATFRRARLCQFVHRHRRHSSCRRVCGTGCRTGQGVPDGAEVVIALDGSFSDDTTALLVGTVSTDTAFRRDAGVGAARPDDAEYRVPVAEVEQTIRDACRRWQVVEIIADPFRWTRTLQALEAERLPVVEFPHSPSRLTAATTDLYSAAVNGRMTHSGDAELAAHVAAAVIVEDARGMRLAKASRSRTAAKIDLAACLVMAHSRATWRATTQNTKEDKEFRMTQDELLLTPVAASSTSPPPGTPSWTGTTPATSRWRSCPRRPRPRWATGSAGWRPTFPRLAVTALAERLRITGFTGDADLWADWIRNDLDQTSGVAHREALLLGDSYVIVWADRSAGPKVTVESAKQVAVLTDPGTRQITAAVKRWETKTTTEAVLYLPDRIVRLRANQTGATTQGFNTVEEYRQPARRRPGRQSAQHRPHPRRLGCSEIDDLKPLVDALNKSLGRHDGHLANTLAGRGVGPPASS